MAVVTYLVLTTVSIVRYPVAYGPTTNWLSDLGNPLVNSSGSLFYNLGCILAATFQFPFYAGLRRWSTEDRRSKVFLAIAQVTGSLSAVSLIMAAVFPLGSHTSTHSFWSTLVFIGIGLFEIFSATYLRRNRGLPRWIAYYGLAAAAVSFAAMAVMGTFLGEWIAIGLFISYVLILCAPLPRPR